MIWSYPADADVLHSYPDPVGVCLATCRCMCVAQLPGPYRCVVDGRARRVGVGGIHAPVSRMVYQLTLCLHAVGAHRVFLSGASSDGPHLCLLHARLPLCEQCHVVVFEYEVAMYHVMA